MPRNRDRVVKIDIDRIRENPDNVRTVLTHLEGLAASIRAMGLREPIIVHQKYEPANGVQDLELVDGARRLAAHQINGATTIEAKVWPYTDPRDILLAMITTTFREHPDAAGMRVAVRKLRDRHAMNTIQIAEELGTTVAQVQAWLRGEGKIPEVPVSAPNTPSPARPVPAELASTTAARARRGSERTPTIRAGRVWDMVEDYDAGKLDGDGLAKRLRGALGGWRPTK